jgi:hypothetical protein
MRVNSLALEGISTLLALEKQKTRPATAARRMQLLRISPFQKAASENINLGGRYRHSSEKTDSDTDSEQSIGSSQASYKNKKGEGTLCGRLPPFVLFQLRS